MLCLDVAEDVLGTDGGLEDIDSSRFDVLLPAATCGNEDNAFNRAPADVGESDDDCCCESQECFGGRMSIPPK